MVDVKCHVKYCYKPLLILSIDTSSSDTSIRNILALVLSITTKLVCVCVVHFDTCTVRLRQLLPNMFRIAGYFRGWKIFVKSWKRPSELNFVVLNFVACYYTYMRYEFWF